MDPNSPYNLHTTILEASVNPYVVTIIFNAHAI